ncbi:MAG: amidase, partial [Olleya sp.]
ADPTLNLKSVDDVIVFNQKDSANVMPYGQKLFRGIVADSATEEEFNNIKKTLKNNGSLYFDIVMKRHNLDAFLSINNYHAGFAAVAENPALTVPMGYTNEGVPKGLTFIGKSEKWLLDYAFLYEQASKKREAPKNYN